MITLRPVIVLWQHLVTLCNNGREPGVIRAARCGSLFYRWNLTFYAFLSALIVENSGFVFLVCSAEAAVAGMLISGVRQEPLSLLFVFPPPLYNRR